VSLVPGGTTEHSAKEDVMGRHITAALAASVITAVIAAGVVAVHGAEAQVKVLATPQDPARETVLIGRALAGDMIIQLELEPAKGMWMAMTASVQIEMDNSKGRWVVLTTPPKWAEHAVEKGELYHVEVKPIDPRSKTRIPYAEIKFKAVNKDTGKSVEDRLHPMWGGSGLHYAFNSGLAGDGTYEATVTVGVPTFARDLKDKGRWMRPAAAKFHFRLAGGKLTEVSQPVAK
jgi:uncharacterized protein involved in high-affinity Fe2+ transport